MKEWYLLSSSTAPNAIGGFENDAYVSYKDDAFHEVLQTDIACSVTLCNSDLSQQEKIRCVIQDNTTNTLLQSMSRTGLFPIGTVRAGMYLYFENRYWLITGYPGNNGIYEKATLSLCQYQIKWQNSTGNIMKRWANVTSANKYDVGENGNEYIRLSSNTYTILIPDDDEGLKLDGKRLFFDKQQLPTKVFKVTRKDDILYDYGHEHGGILSFIAAKTEFNSSTDNQELGICNYFEPPATPSSNETHISNISSIISGETNLKIGRNKNYSAAFFDMDGNELSNVDFQWKIQSDFSEHIQSSIDGNAINLKVNNRNYIGSFLFLQIIKEGTLFHELKIQVSDIY